MVGVSVGRGVRVGVAEAGGVEGRIGELENVGTAVEVG
jgi:hypothetical protein